RPHSAVASWVSRRDTLRIRVRLHLNDWLVRRGWAVAALFNCMMRDEIERTLAAILPGLFIMGGRRGPSRGVLPGFAIAGSRVWPAPDTASASASGRSIRVVPTSASMSINAHSAFEPDARPGSGSGSGIGCGPNRAGFESDRDAQRVTSKTGR